MQSILEQASEVWMEMDLDEECPIYRAPEVERQVIEERLRILRKAQRKLLELADEDFGFIHEAAALRRKIQELQRDLEDCHLLAANRN